jgi:hypothetical protein
MAPRESGDLLARGLERGDKPRRSRELPTISQPLLKKAGVAVTPRRMPSSTAS